MRKRTAPPVDTTLDEMDVDTQPTDPDPDATGDTSAPPVDTATEEKEGADVNAALEEQRDKYLRLAAEYDNYRRRMVRERDEAGARGQAQLISQMVDALDDLARFAHLDPASTDAPTVVQGVDMVERKLHKSLMSAGLEIVNPVDQQFDPERHEAVATEPAESKEQDHTVARVFQPGYVFKGQLIRPARVVVRQWAG